MIVPDLVKAVQKGQKNHINQEFETLADLNEAYYNGVREGIEQYAHWKDGEQFVGTCGTTLKLALKRIDNEEKQALKMLKDKLGVK